MESLPSHNDHELGDLPTEQPDADGSDEDQAVGVAEAALHDGEKESEPEVLKVLYDDKHFQSFLFFVSSTVETLRRLILPHVEEDRWSHDTDDTPTNTMSNGNAERRRQESLETVLDFCINELEPEAPPPKARPPESPPPEDPPTPSRQTSVKVVRKGKKTAARSNVK